MKSCSSYKHIVLARYGYLCFNIELTSLLPSLTDCADKVLTRLASISRMEAKIKDTDPPTPTTPTEQLPVKPEEYRRSSSNKLTRQENREGMFLTVIPPRLGQE